MNGSIISKRLEWLLVTALLAVALLARLIPGERIVDDAYITFRYARNIAEGRGFVYNPGEPVLGTTTPLYTMLLAAVALASGLRDFPTIALIVNTLAGAASVGLLYALGKRVIDHWVPAAAAGALWAVAPYSVAFAIGGMETDLTIALLLAVSYAHLTAKPRWMAALSALAFLARPDTVILTGLLWLDQVLEHRRMPWREGAIGLGLLAPWLIFGTLTFGSPIPGSIAAKSAAYRLSPGESLVRLIQHYSTPFFGQNVLGRGWQLGGFAVYLLICCLGGLRAVRRERRVWPLLAYPYLYLTVFAVANPLLFRWYLSPPLPFYFLFILAGVWIFAGDIGALLSVQLERVVNQYGGRPRNHVEGDQSSPLSFLQTTVLVIFTAAALSLFLSTWELHPDHGPDRPAPEMAWFGGEMIYRRIAMDLASWLEPDDLVAVADIGTFGYYTDARILDPVGLVSPVSRRYFPLPAEQYASAFAVPTGLILDQRPEYVIMLDVYIRHTLLESEAFESQYQVLYTVETDILGSSAFRVYRRSDHI
jgi:hypothetical protein